MDERGSLRIPDTLRGLGGFGLPEWVFVAAGGALGTLFRGLLDAWSGAHPGLMGRPLMWSTLAVNLLGALILGLISAWFGRLEAIPPALARIRLFLATGFCGAFTTYSTFILATTRGAAGDVEGATLAWSLGESLLTLLLGVGAAWVGWRIGRSRVIPVLDLGPRDGAPDGDEGDDVEDVGSEANRRMLEAFEEQAADERRRRDGGDDA